MGTTQYHKLGHTNSEVFYLKHTLHVAISQVSVSVPASIVTPGPGCSILKLEIARGAAVVCR